MGSVGAGRRCRIRAGTANQAHSDNAQNSPGARAPHHMRLSRADTGCIPAMGMRRGVFAHRAGAWQALAARYLQILLFFQRILAGADFSPPINGPPWAPSGRSRRDTSWYGSGALQPVGAVHNGRSHVRHRPAICKPSSPSRMTELGTHSAVAAAVHPMGLVVPVL